MYLHASQTNIWLRVQTVAAENGGRSLGGTEQKVWWFLWTWMNNKSTKHVSDVTRAAERPLQFLVVTVNDCTMTVLLVVANYCCHGKLFDIMLAGRLVPYQCWVGIYQGIEYYDVTDSPWLKNKEDKSGLSSCISYRGNILPCVGFCFVKPVRCLQ